MVEATLFQDQLLATKFFLPTSRIPTSPPGLFAQDTLQYSFMKVVPLLKRFIEVQISSREKQVQQCEDALIEKVLKAIKHLEA